MTNTDTSTKAPASQTLEVPKSTSASSPKGWCWGTITSTSGTSIRRRTSPT